MRVEGKPGKWADLEPNEESTRKVSNDKKKKKGNWKVITIFSNTEVINNICKSSLDEVVEMNTWVV